MPRAAALRSDRQRQVHRQCAVSFDPCSNLYERQLAQMNVPRIGANFADENDVQFAPEGAYGQAGHHTRCDGRYISRTEPNINSNRRNMFRAFCRAMLSAATWRSLPTSNVAGRQGYSTVLSGRSPVTNRTEMVTIYTAQMNSGGLFTSLRSCLKVKPRTTSYAFRNMINSIRLNDQ